jgi:hypothetical protein
MTLQLISYDYLRYNYDVIIDTLQLLRYTYYVTITYVTIMTLPIVTLNYYVTVGTYVEIGASIMARY